MSSGISRIVFWLNVLSFHQSAFIRALAADRSREVHVAFEQDLPRQRTEMGWSLPDFGNAKIWDAREPGNLAALLRFSEAQTCHAFGGYFVTPIATLAFRQLRNAECRRVLISEAFEPHGWRGQVRLLRARWHSLRAGRTGFERVFAMGELGTTFFRRAWFANNQVREFAYTVDSEASSSVFQANERDREVQFVFVGQLIRRKAVDVLLDALAATGASHWQLEIIGDGVERGALEHQVSRRQLGRRVAFRGNLPNSQALAHIQNADCLILPSRWDGWGAVVNEAVLRGTPVIVSDACGAASLVHSPLQGSVVRRECTDSLAEALTEVLSRGPVSAERRAELGAWGRASVGAKAVAEYFMESLRRAEYLDPPWKRHVAFGETGLQDVEKSFEDA